MLKPVEIEITWAIIIIIIVPIRPALPTTQPILKYIITPKIVRIEGVKTPAKAPNFFFDAIYSLKILLKKV